MRGLVAIARTALAMAVVAASGCVTPTSLQTASTVDPGTWRVGAQLSSAPWCSVTFTPERCALAPKGLPLPELRASARTGLAPRTDVGLSLSTSAVIPQGVSVGALFDAKRELWSSGSASGSRQLIAASVGAGGHLDLIGVFDSSSGGGGRVEPGIDIPIAGWYGLKQGGWEWVVSPRFVERMAIARTVPGQPNLVLHSEWLGGTLAAVSPGPFHFVAGIDYLAPVGDLASGPITVSVGGLLVLGGRRGANDR
ncbi:MAG: hypothetical protein IRZ16_13850 [Myxococcaceae bacterium]|nr:hypothetical protein [Myxococcaceae bacterium]